MTEPLAPEDDALAGEFALGLTPADEVAALRARSFSDPGFAAAVALWQERLVNLTDDIAPVAPPTRVKRALKSRLFGTGRVPLMRRLWVWQGISFAALLLAAAISLDMFQPDQAPTRAPVFATQITGVEEGLQVLAVFDPARGDLALNRTAGQAREGRALELWAIAPGQAPVSLGVLPEEPGTRVQLPEALAAIAQTLTLAISDEPPGGSDTGAPTGDVLAVGQVVGL